MCKRLKGWLTIMMLPIVMLLSSCNEEPDVPYSLDIQMLPAVGHVTVNGNNYTVDVSGLGLSFGIHLEGDYESYEPIDIEGSWYSVSDFYWQKPIYGVHFGILFGENIVRSFSFDIKVTAKGVEKTHHFTVNQHSTSDEDLLKLQPTALQYFLSDKIVKDIPYDRNFLSYDIVGDYAPYYKISSNPEVYMQMQSKGKGGPYSSGDPVTINYTTDMNLTLNYFYSEDASPYQSKKTGDIIGLEDIYGEGMLIPLEVGVPLGSEIKLILPTSIQPPADVHSNMLYQYKVIYMP